MKAPVTDIVNVISLWESKKGARSHIDFTF